MKPKDINIAIAEICCIRAERYFCHPVWTYGGEMHYSPPNYHGSLDAMHGAEESHIVGQHDMEYREALEPLCGQYAVIYHATAPQRAEAFLRVFGKWDEPS